jgi:hypothetical protein
MISITDNIIYIEKTLLDFTTLKFPVEDDCYLLTNKDLSKLPHNCICEELYPGLASDKKLSTIETLNDGYDDVTPDYIFFDKDKIRVLEVKTCYFEEMIDAKKKFVHELYEKPCADRCSLSNKTLTLDYLIVSKGSVESSFDVDIERMLFLYNCCIKIKASCKNLGWNFEETDNFIENRDEMMRDLKKIKIHETAELPQISKENIKYWSEISAKACHDSSIQLFTNSVQKCSRTINSAIRLSKQEKDDKYRRQADFQESEYWEAHDAHFNSLRTDLKAPVQVPLFICKPCSDEISDFSRIEKLRRLTIRGSSAIGQAWREAINYACENSSAYEPISEKLTKEERKVRRSRHFRVRPKIPLSASIRLACSGVESKIHSDDITVVQSVANSKKGFKSDVRTDDIEEFVYMNKLSAGHNQHEHLFTDYSQLLDRSLELSGYSKDLKHTNETFSFYDAFRRTDFGISLEILDMIVQEVNISRQQYCKRGEFILKFVPGLDCYLLIKSTSPDKQIFFSVLVPKTSLIKSYDLPFKVMNYLGDVYISEFVSLNQHSCTHLLYIREKATSLLCMWMGLHSVSLSTDLEQIPKHCLSHFNASMLFWLEGKEQTSKETQQIRYAYMECIKNNRFSHDPLKILGKWDEFTRSRLGIWMRHKVISCFKNMGPTTNFVPIDSNNILEFNRSMDRDCKLRSWITGREVGKFEVALNLSYFGVLHNKEDSKEMHGYLKIFEKVLSEEIRMRDVKKENLGVESPENPIDHEFNLMFS